MTPAPSDSTSVVEPDVTSTWPAESTDSDAYRRVGTNSHANDAANASVTAAAAAARAARCRSTG